MSDWPATTFPSSPWVISSFSQEAIGLGILHSSVSSANTNWQVANTAYYIPFVIPVALTAAFMFIQNGNNATGNVDLGIYDRFGTKLVSSGSTTHTGTSTSQAINIADTVIPAGLNYLGVAMTSTSATIGANGGNRPFVGSYQEASAFPLPSTASFATTNIAFIPFVGLTVRTFV